MIYDNALCIRGVWKRQLPCNMYTRADFKLDFLSFWFIKFLVGLCHWAINRNWVG